MSSLGETCLKWHVGLYATAVPLLVRLPLGTLLRLSEPPRWLRPYARLGVEKIRWAVDRRLASPKMMRRRACLRQGLVLYHFLRLAGRDARLHFAVHPGSDAKGKMHGHCWVSLDGQPMTTPAGQDVAVVQGPGSRV